MSSHKPKLPFMAAFAALLLLATGVSCKGFFVNAPNAVNITPSPLPAFANVGDTQQLKAQATFDNGAPAQDVTNSSAWDTSNPCVVSVTTSGRITAVGTGGSTTITVIFNGVSGTATANTPTGALITPCGTFTSGSNQAFTATLGGTDITSSATWTSANTSIVKFNSSSTSVASFGPTTGTAIITATATSGSGSLQVTVK